jgi:predicted 3-demethylubiquinone-9 3-methyltransferase (glyoxalase superfamily)
MPTKISPCFWFDHQAEDAARFYTAIFTDSKILAISRCSEAGATAHFDHNERHAISATVQ